MKKRRAMGERLGRIRWSRVCLAFSVPIAIPLVLAAVRTQPEFAASSQASVLGPPKLRYADLRQPVTFGLPEHSLVLTVEKNDTLDHVLTSGGLSRTESA